MKKLGRPRKNRQEIPETGQASIEAKSETETPIQQELRDFCERIETQEDEKTIAQKTIADLYTQAKEQGIATSILREAIRLRKLKPSERAAYEALRNQYMQILG